MNEKEPVDPVAAGQQIQRLTDAAAERSVSGVVRRAVHASRQHVPQLASASEIPVAVLSAWLQGRDELTTGQLDRLTQALQVELEVVR